MTTETDSTSKESAKTAEKSPQLAADEGNEPDRDNVSSDGELKKSVVTFQKALRQAIANLGEHKKSTSEGFSSLREEFSALLSRHEELKKQLQALQKEAENKPSQADDSTASETEEPSAKLGDSEVPELQKSSPAEVPQTPALVPEEEETVIFRAPLPSKNIERDIFGDVLADDSSIAAERAQLMAGLSADEPAATAMLGQLLVFRAAPSERIPQLLGEVGEAFYRWQSEQGREKEAFRDALIYWLGERCQEFGIANTIDLVRVGDRFEKSRHNPNQSGVEVTEVLGWVVLRDNGKVYTRANVEVK